MEPFSAALFTALSRTLETLAGLPDDSSPVPEATRASWRESFAPFLDDCISLGLSTSATSIRKILKACSEGKCDTRTIRALAVELQGRLIDEMVGKLFFSLSMAEAEHYIRPWKGWEEIIDRFPNTVTDVEEARKCLALRRYTAAVFHLMRVTEAGVLDLQCFLDTKPDPKAHFGSVLSKLEHLHTKTRFENLPEHLKPSRQFLIDILAQLHSVKDSWRNKVSHVDDRISIADVFTEEMALGVYNATLLLMKKLASGLPKLDSADNECAARTSPN
jgi:hypothetical protein